MKSRQEYIDILHQHTQTIRNEFGVRSLCIFGSVAKGEQDEYSDVDVCVDMDAKMFLVIRLKRYLENLLGNSVDVVRLHKGMNPFLKSEINRYGVYLSF
ncbi:MAG: DNA polymerase subunit beta [Bacteroides sp.]|nr:DNA polymerase subunit beta [Bacteroides sp.]